jgi:hypothetical protein
MPSTTARRGTARSATCGAAVTVGLLVITACGMGHVSVHASPGEGPSYAVDTAPTARPHPVASVRIHAHMGRPAAHRDRAALG